MRIAVLEDDDVQLRAICRLLTSAGHHCHPFASSRSLLRALRNETYDLLVLDWNLPDLPGIEVLRWSRQNLNSAPPVLMLTSRADEADIVAGLNAGADDYIVKPPPPTVLIARVGAILRRAHVAAESRPIERYDDYLFDTTTQTVQVGGEEIVLTTKEFRLALLLFQNLHRALSRDHLLEVIWGRSPDVQTRTLDQHISRVRIKLSLRPEHGYKLIPVYSYGYRLEKLADISDVVERA
jgi:DNA-binding response OmpR family regulator